MGADPPQTAQSRGGIARQIQGEQLGVDPGEFLERGLPIELDPGLARRRRDQRGPSLVQGRTIFDGINRPQPWQARSKCALMAGEVEHTISAERLALKGDAIGEAGRVGRLRLGWRAGYDSSRRVATAPTPSESDRNKDQAESCRPFFHTASVDEP